MTVMPQFSEAASAGAKVALRNIRRYGPDLDEHPQSASGEVGSAVISALGAHGCESFESVKRETGQAWTLACEQHARRALRFRLALNTIAVIACFACCALLIGYL